MAETWNAIPRTNLDNTTIDEAIATAMDAHNDDPDAHLGADQALQSHRAAEIIDHLAQSVVNDKLAAPARAYIAVVGSGLAGDFSTIKDAVDYAMGTTGGTILIMPGTYAVDDEIVISPKINLYGVDTESCIITRNTTGWGFYFVNDDETSQRTCYWRNLTFQFTTPCTLIRRDYLVGDASTTLRIEDCRFYNSHTVVLGLMYLVSFTRCYINSTTDAYSEGGTSFEFHECDVTLTAGTGSTGIFKADGTGTVNSTVSLYGSIMRLQNSAAAAMFSGDYGTLVSVIDSNVTTLRLNHVRQCPGIINGSTIAIYTGQALTIGGHGTGDVYQDSIFTGGATPNLVSGSNGGLIMNCSYTGNPRVSTYPLKYSASTGRPEKYTLPAASTAIDCTLGRTIQHTPTGSKTLTASGAVYGDQVVLEIFTSTTSYTMTFGSGFKDVSTLATGTTGSRKFILVFMMTQSGLVQIYRGSATTI